MLARIIPMTPFSSKPFLFVLAYVLLASPAGALDDLHRDQALASPSDSRMQRLMKGWGPTLAHHCEHIAEIGKWLWSHSVKEEHAEIVEIAGMGVGFVTCKYVVPRFATEKPRVEPELHYDPDVLKRLMRQDRLTSIESLPIHLQSPAAVSPTIGSLDLTPLSRLSPAERAARIDRLIRQWPSQYLNSAGQVPLGFHRTLGTRPPGDTPNP